MPAPSAEPIPADARRALFIYNLCFPIVFLALLPGFLLRLFRRGNYREGFGQRLGLYSGADRQRLGPQHRLWIHSISVGETLIALKLARELHAADAECRILLSTTTTTGFALARETTADWLEPIYNPVDFLPIVRRTLDALQPSRIALIEGEAWPNLLAESRRRGIPVTLANARLSPRSERRFRNFRHWTGPIFRLLESITLAEPDDLARWESLGLPREKLRVTGNIKFDSTAPGVSRAEEFRALAVPLGIGAETPVLVAGSTFEGEEKIFAAALIELRQTHPRLFLILAPRHVERLPAILRDLAAFNLRVVRRTALPAPQSAQADVLLIDTTGELRDWYHLATIVFIGKSLTAIGGQNPAEPVLIGKPVLFGPHMENFGPLVQHLLAQEGAVQVADAQGLTVELRALLDDPTRRAALGERGRNALAAHQGATPRTARLLLPGVAS